MAKWLDKYKEGGLMGPKAAPITLDGTEVFEHGEDTATAKHKENGVKPTDLTKKGQKYAEKVGVQSAKRGKTDVVSSGIERAQQTADIIADVAGAEREINPLLNTWNIGDFDGKKEGSFKEKDWVKNADKAPKNGESFNSFAQRMEQAYDFVKNAPKTDEVITHSKVTRAFKALANTDGQWTPDTTKQFLDLKNKKAKDGLILKKKTQDNYGTTPNANDGHSTAGPGWVGEGTTNRGFDYNGAWGGTMQMGGSLPGSVGFMYARTQNPAPANGKYTKKTLASAQNGQEMKFYQEGLDFKPKSISKNGKVIKDDRGQWAHPGEITEIGSPDITMQGVDYPVLGISDTGHTQMMYPDQDYKFDGEKVTEFPMAQDGDWLKKYATEPMRQDATRNVIPRMMTADEKKEAQEKSIRYQEAVKTKHEQIAAEREKNRTIKGDLNTPGSWHLADKFRFAPNDVGGIKEIADEYLNPFYLIGSIADKVGEGIANRSVKKTALGLGEAAFAGALGFDPLGGFISTVNNTAEKLSPFVDEAINHLDNKFIVPVQYKNEIKAIKDLHSKLPERFSNPEVASRLKFIGIDPQQHLELPNLRFATGNQGSYYSALDNSINLDMRQIAELQKSASLDPNSVYEHELGHYLQREAHRHSPRFKQELEEYSDQLQKYQSKENQSLLTNDSYDLLKEHVPQPLKPIPNAYPTSVDEFASRMLTSKPELSDVAVGNLEYFNYPNEVERFAHLREMRQNMVNKGVIPNQYHPVSDEQIEKFLNLNTKDRVSSFTSNDPANIRNLRNILRMAPAVAPVAVGAGALATQATPDKQKDGGWLNKYK